jgi:hypothetical protein
VIFARRGKLEPDPFLERKVQLFLVGAALALVGIGIDSPLLVGLAILVLLLGMALRFFAKKEPDHEGDTPDRGDTDVDHDSQRR